ncbi:hypothetical protein [Sphingomonas humi]|uniref:Uncharacterized protein n=1 Tax=Sphingomonas humi TaxID=335630 RepID=A0ABP7RZY0_9SPHN
MLSPALAITITPNRVAVRNIGDGRSASADAPFSCSHLLADDVDILEHAALHAIKAVIGGGILPKFPKVIISTAGQPLHRIERKTIAEALLNAGASTVEFATDVGELKEQAAARAAYIDLHWRTR